MATINDLDDLVDGTDIVVDTALKTIRIKPYNAGTNATGVVLLEGATGGVTGQALYSWLKSRWKVDTTYVKYPFPMEAISPESFEFINGWTVHGDETRSLIRSAGWAEKDLGGALLRQYVGVVSLGSLGATDQPYYQWNSLTSVNLGFQGPVNEGVQIYGNASNGNFDHRAVTEGGDFVSFKVFCREQGKTYTSSSASAIGAAGGLTYITYRFPLSNATDINISASDVSIAGNVGFNYSQITVDYVLSPLSVDVDSQAPLEQFSIVITDGTGVATTKQIYEKVQYLLRQSTDISVTGTVIGKTADVLLNFVGNTLVGTTGVFISGLNADYKNSVTFFDNTGTKKEYVFYATGSIQFGSFATSGDFKYWMFYDNTPNNQNFGDSDALLVNNVAGAAIAGTYDGNPYQWNYDIDANTQGGRVPGIPGQPVNVVVVGLGLSGGQWTRTNHTITRTQGQTIQITPNQERNYSNPA